MIGISPPLRSRSLERDVFSANGLWRAVRPLLARLACLPACPPRRYTTDGDAGRKEGRKAEQRMGDDAALLDRRLPAWVVK